MKVCSFLMNCDAHCLLYCSNSSWEEINDKLPNLQIADWWFLDGSSGRRMWFIIFLQFCSPNLTPWFFSVLLSFRRTPACWRTCTSQRVYFLDPVCKAVADAGTDAICHGLTWEWIWLKLAVLGWCPGGPDRWTVGRNPSVSQMWLN